MTTLERGRGSFFRTWVTVKNEFDLSKKFGEIFVGLMKGKEVAGRPKRWLGSRSVSALHSRDVQLLSLLRLDPHRAGQQCRIDCVHLRMKGKED